MTCMKTLPFRARAGEEMGGCATRLAGDVTGGRKRRPNAPFFARRREAALTLATTLGADLILIDDRKAAAWHCRKDSRSPERWAFSLARLSVAYLTLPVRSIGLSS